jgi:hypothetical protein
MLFGAGHGLCSVCSRDLDWRVTDLKPEHISADLPLAALPYPNLFRLPRLG